MNIDTFGKILREKRLQCGLSQYQLGMLLKVSDKAVSKWENGLARPRSQLLYQLSIILGTTVDELLVCEKCQSYKKSRCLPEVQHGYLWNRAYSKLMEIYGDRPPIEIISRFEMEKLALMNTDMILFFDLISQISNKALTKGCPIFQEGGVGASYVAYLLGASDVNPLPAHYYCSVCKETVFVPEVSDGWDLEKKICNNCHSNLVRDGHNIPFEVYRHVIGKNVGFDLVVSRCFYKEAEEMIIQYFSSDVIDVLDPPPEVVSNRNISQMVTYVIRLPNMQKQTKQNFTNYSYDEYYNFISDKPYINLIFMDDYEKYIALKKIVNVPCSETGFLDDKVQQSFFKGDVSGLPDFGLHCLPQLMYRFKINNFEDALRLYGIAFCSSVFTEEQVSAYMKQWVNLAEVITYRDDVYLHICSKLKQHGYHDFGLAFRIMDQTRKGVYYRCGMEEHIRKLLLDIGVSERYIACLEEVAYLFPKVQGIINVRQTLILLWYRIQYPKEFNYVFGERINDFE